MSQPYVGEISMFGGNFAPQGWAFCEGQTLAISDNNTLFQLIGTFYGGDGQQTFKLPDLRGRIPLHQGTSNFGSSFTIAQVGGQETATLTTQQLPAHTHAMIATNNLGSSSAPVNSFFAKSSSNTPYTSDTSTGIIPLKNAIISATGGQQPHDNMQPYLCINFIISLFGVFPSQN